MLLSATPMQIEPWEPWDLLSVLGEGGAWLADFAAVRNFYDVLADVTAAQTEPSSARRAAETMVADSEFPPLPGDSQRCLDVAKLAQRLVFAPPARRNELARWMRTGSPLYRRMHRNTRDTLRRYHAMGLLDSAPPRRVHDERRMALAKQREKRALASQLAAARLRLMRELGRFLVCVTGTSTDLNGVFHEQMTREIAGAERLQRAYQLLGGYPEWPEQMKAEIDLYYRGLSKNQRIARLMASELEAALEDPRWTASETSH